MLVLVKGMKKFACRDTGMDCPFETSAESEEELMQKISAHAKEAHGLDVIDDAMMQKVKEAIQDEPSEEQEAEEDSEDSEAEAEQ